jgi:hypothetical protein
LFSTSVTSMYLSQKKKYSLLVCIAITLTDSSVFYHRLHISWLHIHSFFFVVFLKFHDPKRLYRCQETDIVANPSQLRYVGKLRKLVDIWRQICLPVVSPSCSLYHDAYVHWSDTIRGSDDGISMLGSFVWGEARPTVQDTEMYDTFWMQQNQSQFAMTNYTPSMGRLTLYIDEFMGMNLHLNWLQLHGR